MFEAYSIGVTLKLHNLISPQLALLSQEFAKLDALTLGLNKSLGKISVDSTALRSLTTATNATNRAFERANVSAQAFKAHLAGIHAAGAAFVPPRLPGTGGAPGGGGGGGGGRGGGGNYGQGSGFHGGNIHMGPGGVGLGTVGMAAGDWFWPLAASGAAIYGGKALFESAKDLDTEHAKFRMFGMSEAQNNEAFDFARRMRIYGSTQTENMAAFRESQGVFREAGLDGSEALRGAKIASPILAKLDALDSALDDESAAKSKTSNLAMLRFVESAGGLKSQDEFNRLANLGYRLKVSSGDTVDWQQLMQFQKRAGSFGLNLTGEAMARLEPSISTLGGSAAGVALATGGGRLEGIVKGLPVPVIDELLKYGVWDKNKVELNSKGGIAKFLDPRGPMSGEMSKLLTENPEQFYESVIRPIYSKMNLDAAGVIRQNVLIYGRTGGALANEWEKQLSTISRAVDAFKKTLTIDQATLKLPDTLTGQEKEFDAAWKDFKTNWGTSMLPFFTGILKAGAFILRPSGPAVSGQQGEEDFRARLTAANPGRHWVEGALDGNRPGSGGHWESDDTGTKVAFGRMPDKPITVNTQINLDGQKIASAVTKVQAKSSGAPQTGISDFDPLLGQTPAGGLSY